MADLNQHAFASSTFPPLAGAALVGSPASETTLSVTVRVRRKPGAPELPSATTQGQLPAGSRTHLTREQFAERYGAASADLDRVKSFASTHGLSVTTSDAARRSVTVEGTAAQMDAAFGVELRHYHTGAIAYLSHAGEASVPADLAEIVESVHGLDTRPLAQPLNRQAPSLGAGISAPLGTAPLLPAQVARLYDIPTNSAAGQCIAILEFGGGYLPGDVQQYFGTIAHLPVPDVTSVGVDNATNAPGDPADSEVILDIAVAGSVAPGAKIVVYFAPNTGQGWIDCISTAIHDAVHRPTTISISWGGDESGWGSVANTISNVLAEAAHLGITVFASSGDSGSETPPQVLYPASDPNIMACGGTTISNVSGLNFTQSAWSGSGGGVSNTFARPIWQSWANVPPSKNPAGHVGRGVPDIAGNADPASGYALILKGSSIGVWGGTSAVAPFYAGMVAVLNASFAAPLGFMNGNAYALKGPFAFDDVTAGNNGAYTAGPGWDAVTGLGSVNGANFATGLFGVGLPPAIVTFKNQLFMAWKGIEFDDRIFTTHYNGSTWAPQSSVPNVATSSGVALAAFNSQLYMAWKGAGNDQNIYWSHFNGINWTPQQQIPGIATSTGPRLALFQNKLFMAWKGMEDDQRLWWSSFNGSVWAPQQSVPGVGSSVGPAIAAFGTGLVAVWKGQFGDPGLWYSTFNGSAWAPQKQIVNTGSSEGPSLAVFNNQLFAAWKGEFSDERLWYASYNGSTWTPQKQISFFGSSVGPGLTSYNGKLVAVWKGIHGDDRIWYSAFEGTTWANQQIVPGVGTSVDLLRAA